jgi:hypothetical protein
MYSGSKIPPEHFPDLHWKDARAAGGEEGEGDGKGDGEFLPIHHA